MPAIASTRSAAGMTFSPRRQTAIQGLVFFCCSRSANILGIGVDAASAIRSRI